MPARPPAIAIDGPAGAGKSTLAPLLAEKLGLPYLDTGATYRAFAVYALERGIDPEDREQVVAALEGFDLSMDEHQRVFVNGEDVTSRLRDNEVSDLTSRLAVIPELRHRLVEWQREFARERGAVMDGRDIGSRVLPWAPVKFFVTAAPEVRARRRVEQLQAQGREADFATILKEIQARDTRDSTRDEAPLMQTHDALLVDTGGKTITATLNVMYSHVHSVLRERDAGKTS